MCHQESEDPQRVFFHHRRAALGSDSGGRKGRPPGTDSERMRMSPPDVILSGAPSCRGVARRAKPGRRGVEGPVDSRCSLRAGSAGPIFFRFIS